MGQHPSIAACKGCNSDFDGSNPHHPTFGEGLHQDVEQRGIDVSRLEAAASVKHIPEMIRRKVLFVGLVTWESDESAHRWQMMEQFHGFARTDAVRAATSSWLRNVWSNYCRKAPRSEPSLGLLCEDIEQADSKVEVPDADPSVPTFAHGMGELASDAASDSVKRSAVFIGSGSKVIVCVLVAEHIARDFPRPPSKISRGKQIHCPPE
eukprot:SAG31_NODE_4166_length_3518_cov_2.348055_6_plen_208_part_00